MRNLAALVILAIGLTGAVQASEDDAVDAAVGTFLQGLVEARDVGLAFDYLRDALDAAMHGRDAAPPEALTQRAEAIAGEAKRRGAVAGRALLDAIERSIRESMRTPRAAPVGTAQQRI